MGFLELFLTAVGLSMDACAVGICAGLTIKKELIKKAFIIGLYFGVFQGVMPLIGYLAATWLADRIITFDHWIAFSLLCFLGGRMILESFKKDEKCDIDGFSVKPSKMLPFAFATSIDALAVGVSFALLKVDIIPAVCFIGATTLVLSFIGVIAGSSIGVKLKSKAEFTGGVILILIGLKILLEHLNIISF